MEIDMQRRNLPDLLSCVPAPAQALLRRKALHLHGIEVSSDYAYFNAVSASFW